MPSRRRGGLFLSYPDLSRLMERSPIFLVGGDRDHQPGTLHRYHRQRKHRIRQYHMISELTDFTDIDEPIKLRYVQKNQDACWHPITAEITARQRQCSGGSMISKTIYRNLVSIFHTAFTLSIS